MELAPWVMASVFPTPSPSVGAPPSADAKITRGHSCVLCRRRKIKCSGKHPCQNCQKARVVCVAAEVVPARRKKRKQEDLAERLKRAEDVISKAGLKIDNDDEDVYVSEGSESGRTMESDVEKSTILTKPQRLAAMETQGNPIAERGQSRHLESSIWEHINTEVREESFHLAQQPSSEDETGHQLSPASDYSSLLFGRLMVRNSLTSSHPHTIQIFRLWQFFLNNINPLTKILHAPTIQELILNAGGDLDQVSASTEALLFSIYHSAIVSMDEQECQTMFRESRVPLIAKYSTATQQALVNANILRTSNLMVLQAFTLYLLSIRQFTDHDTVWALSGLAARIGQRMGLHRESTGTNLGVLETEIRKRLWWQILTLEGHSSALSGSPAPATFFSHPGHRLLNVSDSELSPSMREPPAEHPAVTEMLFCCIRQHISLFMWSHMLAGEESSISAMPIRSEQIATKIKALNDLDVMLQQKFIRFCDSSIPLHYLARLATRSSLSKIRLRVYAAPRIAGSPPQPKEEKDIAFETAVKLLEYDKDGHDPSTRKLLKGFMWHIRVFFQLEAFIYMISELRTRTTGTQVDWAWDLVGATYANHEEILRETKNKLWFAVGNLCLKAWEQRVRGLRSQQGAIQVRRPACIRELYAQRYVKKQADTPTESSEMSMGLANPTDIPQMQNITSFSGQWNEMDMPSTYVPFDTGDMGEMDWEYWQTLFSDYGMQMFSG